MEHNHPNEEYTPPAGVSQVDTALWSTQDPFLTALEARRAGLPVFPLDEEKRPVRTGGLNNRGEPARLAWGKYQKELPSERRMEWWNTNYHPPVWGVATGSLSGVILLEGDGQAGLETWKRLGLNPHLLSGRGGPHQYFRHPGWYVKTLNHETSKDAPWAKAYPGLDIRGDGGYAAFCGKSSKGRYTWLRPFVPDPLDLLPEDLRKLLGLFAPGAKKGHKVTTAQLLAWAFDKIEALGGRDNAGFALACQLRDNGYSEQEAEDVLREYARQVPPTDAHGRHDPFTEGTAIEKVRSAYKEQARDPWGTGAGQHQASKDGLPDIIISGQLRDQMSACLTALQQANAKKLRMFTHLSFPSVIALDETHKPYILRLGSTELRNELTFAANFFVPIKGGHKSGPPPRDLADQLLGLPPNKWPVPPLKALVEAPVLRPDGSILDQPGYDEVTRLYYYPSKEMQRCTIPDSPTQADARQVMDFLHPIFADFPFEGDPDRANAFGALFTPFVRYAVKGDAQMALLDATNAGSGKGKICHVVSLVATGAITAPIKAQKDEAEWGKTILSKLLTGPRIMIIDNVRGVLESATLDLILTSADGGFSERILGVSKTAQVKNEATWLCTGNNLLLGGDLARRCYRIRLIAQTASPDERDPSTFKIPDLEGWVKEHRPEIVTAILTICRAWFVAGQPQPSSVPFMGDFSPWAKTIGGILEFAGVMGFQGNRDALRSRNDEESAEWAAFLGAWYERYGSDWQTSANIADELKKSTGGVTYENGHFSQPPAKTLFEVLPQRLKKSLTERPNGFEVSLGIQLRVRLQTVYGPSGYRIENDRQGHEKKNLWRVVRVVAGGHSAQRVAGKSDIPGGGDAYNNSVDESGRNDYPQPTAEQNGHVQKSPSIGSNTGVHDTPQKETETAFAGGCQKNTVNGHYPPLMLILWQGCSGCIPRRTTRQSATT